LFKALLKTTLPSVMC